MKICKQCLRRYRQETRICPVDQRVLLQASFDSQECEAEPLIGQVLGGKFQLTGIIGRGGVGTVFLANYLLAETEVAVKVVVANEVTELMFGRELRAIFKLSSVHTVKLLETGQTPAGLCYLAMELLEGHTLGEVLRNQGALPWRRALHITAQTLEGLVEAHAREVIHRDIKPGNLFLSPQGSDPDFLRILDFGIAKLPGPGATLAGADGNIVPGTAKYVSPDQIRWLPIDGRADVYSLGVVLHELLTGRPPYLVQDPAANFCLCMYNLHCTQPIPTLAEHKPDLLVPFGLQQLVTSMLAKEREDRPTAAEALARLRFLQALPDPSAHHGSTTRPVGELPTVKLSRFTVPDLPESSAQIRTTLKLDPKEQVGRFFVTTPTELSREPLPGSATSPASPAPPPSDGELPTVRVSPAPFSVSAEPPAADRPAWGLLLFIVVALLLAALGLWLLYNS